MKIALVCPYNVFGCGGVQECVFAIQEGLIKLGHEAYVISSKPNGHEEVPKNGLILLGTARPIRVAKTSAHVSATIETDKLDEVLQRENFDVIHFHEPWVPMLSLQILTKSNAAHVATFHAAMSERFTSRTVEKVIIPYTKSIIKHIDVLTAVSPTATNYIKTLTRKNIQIVSNGIDLAKYRFDNIHKINPKHKTIFYVGRLEKRKGIKYLLDAFKLISDHDKSFNLVIAGDGPDREKLEDYAERQSIKNVKFLGYIDEPTKLKYLSEADIFCSAAIYGESFGIVLLEAMAKGCVVVAGDNGGYESVMTGLGQISLVNPKDSYDFARRLRLLATDEELRQVWKNWAKKHVKQFDYKNVIDEYLKIYQKAYERHQK